MQPASEFATVNAPSHKMSPEEFAFETRFVVLNYLGQLQAKSSSEGSFSSSGSGGRRKLQTQSSSSSGSSHARPSSVSPRAPSVSPRQSDQAAEDDSQIVGAQAYDAKLNAIQAITQRGKAQDAKRRVNAEILTREQSTDQSRKSTDQEQSFDSVDTSSDEGRRKISEILEKKSREARVLEELKNRAVARIEEIRAHYECNASQQDFYDQFPRFRQSDGTTEQYNKNRESSVHHHSEHSYSFLELDSGVQLSGMLPQAGYGMVPQMMSDDAPSPSVYTDSGTLGDMSVPFNQCGGGGTDASYDISPISPTRPNNLDGLKKTSDVIGETEKSRGQKLPQPQKDSAKWNESVGKRDGIPRPPPPSREKSPSKRDAIPRPSEDKTSKEKSPSVRDGIPRPPSQDQRPVDEQTGAGDAGARVGLDREFSQESEFYTMDSPLSDLSSLTWSGRSVISDGTSSRSSVVIMNEVCRNFSNLNHC